MAAISLRERGGLRGRLSDTVCPVMWLHVSCDVAFRDELGRKCGWQGTSDAVYLVDNAQVDIKLFTNSLHADLVTVKDGQHFLSASHPKEVDSTLIEFVTKWHKP